MIIFIHGYGTSNVNNPNLEMLRREFGVRNVIAPVLKHEPLNDIRYLSDLIIEAIFLSKKILLVGTSLGGFYARILAARCGVKAVLINPSFDPSVRLTNYGEFKKYDCDDTFIWTEESNNELKKLEQEMISFNEFKTRLHFFVATDDELIDHSGLKNEFPFVKEYDNAGHRFFRFEEIVPDIRSIYEKIS